VPVAIVIRQRHSLIAVLVQLLHPEARPRPSIVSIGMHVGKKTEGTGKNARTGFHGFQMSAELQ
jgi:hypothetical protein